MRTRRTIRIRINTNSNIYNNNNNKDQTVDVVAEAVKEANKVAMAVNFITLERWMEASRV